MDPGSKKDLLQRACGLLRRYDKQRSAVVPIAAFSCVLDDLGLKYGDEEAEFLTSFTDFANDGCVAYRRMLEALGEESRPSKKN